MSDLSLSGFAGALVAGARPNLFKVEIGNLGNKIQFMAKATTLPGADLGEILVPYQGREYPIPGNRTFQEWEITVINDIDFGIRNLLEEWMAQINGHETNVGESAIATNMKDGMVTQLGRDGAELKHYQFLDMWPKTIAPVELAWDSNDTISEFQTTFRYSRWLSPEAATN